MGFEVLSIPYFVSVPVKAEGLKEIEIGIVVSERSYDLGFDTRVDATDYYMYYTNHTVDELKRRGFGGIYKISDLDLNDTSQLSQYDIIWVSTYASNVSTNSG